MATTGREPETELRAQFGARIREQRRNLGVSQEELAAIAGIDRTYLSSIERGQRNVALENICRIAEALDIDPRVLVGGLRTQRRSDR